MAGSFPSLTKFLVKLMHFFFIAIQAQESLGKPLRNSLYILGFNILTILNLFIDKWHCIWSKLIGATRNVYVIYGKSLSKTLVKLLEAQEMFLFMVNLCPKLGQVVILVMIHLK